MLAVYVKLLIEVNYCPGLTLSLESRVADRFVDAEKSARSPPQYIIYTVITQLARLLGHTIRTNKLEHSNNMNY